MESRRHRLRIREVDRPVFEALRSGRKKIETRAGTPAYEKIGVGDQLQFVCGGDIFQKEVASVRHFASISDLLKVYTVEQINPNVRSAEELAQMYKSFPNYAQRIKECGILAWELT